jgi:hypothetical protein
MIDKSELTAGLSSMRACGPESTGNLERLLDLSPGLLFRQQADFSFEYLGPKIEEWTGVPRDEWLRPGNLLWDLVHEADAVALKGHLATCAKAINEMHATFRIRNRKTGRISYIAESRRAVRDDAGMLRGFEGVWTDESQETLAARQLDAAVWQATFGLVTLGAVHDLNNKLTGILSLSDLYLAEVDKDHPLRDGLSTIKQSAQQASQLLHQLAALHQGAPGKREHVDLNQFVTVAADLLRRIVSSRIRIEEVLHKDPLAVTVDRVSLQRLVIAWSLHAAERMPKGGKLKLHTRSAVPKESPTLTITDSGRPFVVPERRDHGFVVRENVEAAICDQLAALAQSHNGNFRVDAKSNGTTLEIALPQATFTEQPATGGTPWILLVGKVPQELNALTRELERRDIRAVIAKEPLDEQLNPNWYQWGAVLIQATVAAVPELLEPVQQSRKGGMPVKTIVCVAGGDVADLEPWVASAAELVTPTDMSHERIAEKIAKLFM